MKIRLNVLGFCGACCWTAIFFPSISRADILLVQNHSFEAPSLSDGDFLVNPPGWALSNDGSQYNPTESQYSSALGLGTPLGADGSQVGYAFSGTSLKQNLAGADGIFGNGDDPLLKADTIYTLTVAIGQRADFPNQGYVMQLLAVGSDTSIIASDINNISPVTGGFADRSISVNSNTLDPSLYGRTLRINLSSGPSSIYLADFDNVRLSANAVPEPNIVLFVLVGGVFVLCRRPRRKND